MFLLEVPIAIVKPQRMWLPKISTDIFLISWTLLLFDSGMASSASLERYRYSFDAKLSNSSYFEGTTSTGISQNIEFSTLNVSSIPSFHYFMNASVTNKELNSPQNSLTLGEHGEHVVGEKRTPNSIFQNKSDIHKDDFRVINVSLLNDNLKSLSSILHATLGSQQQDGKFADVQNFTDNFTDTDKVSTILNEMVTVPPMTTNSDKFTPNEIRQIFQKLKESFYQNSSQDEVTENSKPDSSHFRNSSNGNKVEIESSKNKRENETVDAKLKGKKTESSRQFVFHPYLPYEKDIMPDEKISFHDVLPVKMVKFIKSMVEEAPWEQMFMKMVRMIVDQFVDKIIEKMFAHKDEDHDKWRSLDMIMTPTWVLPTFSTPVVRLRRSVEKEKQNEDVISLLSANKFVKEHENEKTSSHNRSWLDQVLDYFFPEPKFDEDVFHQLKRRDVPSSQKEFRVLTPLFRHLESFLNNSGSNRSDIQGTDDLSFKLLKEYLTILLQKKAKYSNSGSLDTSLQTNSLISQKFSVQLLTKSMKRDFQDSDLPYFSERFNRRKRSLDRSANREEDEKRLWQASRRNRPPNQQKLRDDCSLRKACNAGRLLARLPSVKEITLQLRSYGDEPHWDALLWGMKKKRCSRVFCKRRRSPKGSHHYWNSPEDRRHKRIDLGATASPENSSEDIDLVTL